MNNLATAGILALVLFLTPLTRMSAQRPAPSGFGTDRTPVVIAVVEQIKDQKDAEVVVLRRANMTPHDVILVTKNRVDAAWLAEAVWTLQAARSMDGNIPTTDATYRVALRPGSPDRKALKEHAKDWAKALKNDPPPRLVEGIGELPQFVLFIPDKLPKMRKGPKPK